MYSIGFLDYSHIVWAVEVAAKSMLVEEAKRPDLVNTPHLYKMAEKIINEQTGLVVFKNGEPVGCIAALLSPNPYNPEVKTLVELFWYVVPEHRKGRAGYILLNNYIRLAEEISDEATLSLLATSDVNTSSLEKRGFKLKEFAFSYQKEK